jgi:hypothetical protein
LRRFQKGKKWYINPGAHPASHTMGMALTTHPHLVLRLKNRAIPLLLLWAFVACSRVNFTFTFTHQVGCTKEIKPKPPH